VEILWGAQMLPRALSGESYEHPAGGLGCSQGCPLENPVEILMGGLGCSLGPPLESLFDILGGAWGAP
jgi:hypothetical protein